MGSVTMVDWTILRPIWEPRMLSILRIMVGLLYLEFGFAKIFDFPAMSDLKHQHNQTIIFNLADGAIIANAISP